MQKLLIHIWTCARVAHPSRLRHIGGLKLWTYQLFLHIPELWQNVTGTIATEGSQTLEGAPWLHDCHQSSNKSSDWNLRLPRWPESANMGRTNSLFWITKTFVCWWCVPSLGFHLKSRPGQCSGFVWLSDTEKSWPWPKRSPWRTTEQPSSRALNQHYLFPTQRQGVCLMCHSVITPAGVKLDSSRWTKTHI